MITCFRVGKRGEHNFRKKLHNLILNKVDNIQNNSSDDETDSDNNNNEDKTSKHNSILYKYYIYDIHNFHKKFKNNIKINKLKLLMQNDYKFKSIINLFSFKELKNTFPKSNKLTKKAINDYSQNPNLLFAIKSIHYYRKIKDKIKLFHYLVKNYLSDIIGNIYFINFIDDFFSQIMDKLILRYNNIVLDKNELNEHEEYMIQETTDDLVSFCKVYKLIVNYIPADFYKKHKFYQNYYLKIIVNRFKTNFREFSIVFYKNNNKTFFKSITKSGIFNITLSYLITLLNINNKTFYDLYSKNKKVTKLLIKNKLKILPYLHYEPLKKLILNNLKINSTKLKILTLNEEIINDMPKYYDFTMLKNTWGEIYKTVNIKNKTKLSNIIKKLYLKYKQSTIIIDFLYQNNLILKTSILDNLFKFCYLHEIEDTKACLIYTINNFIKNFKNIKFIRKYIYKIKEFPFSIIRDHVNYLLEQNKTKIIKTMKNSEDISEFYKRDTFFKNKKYCENLFGLFTKQKFSNFIIDIDDKECNLLINNIYSYIKWGKGIKDINCPLDEYSLFNQEAEIFTLLKYIIYFLMNTTFQEKFADYIITKPTCSEIKDADCPICFEKININNSAKLYCKHIYCKTCILECFKNIDANFNLYNSHYNEVSLQFNCPYCRYDVFSLNIP